MPFIGPHAVNQPTFREIERRLSHFSPSIKLREHLVDNPSSVADLEVHELTLQGIDFTLKDPDKFRTALETAKTGTEKAFTVGSTRPADWKQHWAMTASFLATKGIGFREPWRYYLNGRATQLDHSQPPILNAPQFDRGFAEPFAGANTIDLTALHISIAYGKWTECNIHIDETGVAMVGMLDNVTITPNVISHAFNELILKTVVGEILPTWFKDRVNLHVLSPEMGYKRIGVSVDVFKRDSFKVTLNASCGLTSCKDIEFTKIVELDTIKSLNPTAVISGTF